MKDKSILAVDDESELLKMLQSVFERAGYTKITTASSGKEALAIFRENQPDMVILDVMMPGIDGFTVLKEIRKTSTIPVLMLTARGEADDKFLGFENGADDYLIKPFLPKELLLRVQAILNRAYPEKERIVYLEASTVNLDKAEVYRGDEVFSLTAKEFTLFEKLFDNSGRIVTTGSLCETVWTALEKSPLTAQNICCMKENPSSCQLDTLTRYMDRKRSRCFWSLYFNQT